MREDLIATVMFWSGRWRYRVVDAGSLLEEGELGLAHSGDAPPQLIYLLRHRWPELDPRACAVIG